MILITNLRSHASISKLENLNSTYTHYDDRKGGNFRAPPLSHTNNEQLRIYSVIIKYTAHCYRPNNPNIFLIVFILALCIKFNYCS